MMVIAVASQKGGTAKTTTTAHLGLALAERGKRVLVLDMDPQGHLGEAFGVPSHELDQEISQVLEQKIPLTAIVNEVRPNLFLAPANINLSDIEPTLINMYRREDRLKQALQSVNGTFEYVLIDCPPSLGILTVNALSAADQVLIPMAADYFGLLGLAQLLRTVEKMRLEINPQLRVLGVVATRMTRTHNAREILDRVQEELAAEVRIFTVVVPETVRFREAAGIGKTIFEYAPDTQGAAAYRMLAEEVDNCAR